MTWSDTYSVGVTVIDAEHKHLVGMVNGMLEVLKRGARPEEVQALLEDLLQYANSHFAHEEKLMAQAGYEGLEEHRAKHASMKSEVVKMLGAAEAGSTSVALKLMEFLKRWLAMHINGTDKLYVPALRKAGLV